MRCVCGRYQTGVRCMRLVPSLGRLGDMWVVLLSISIPYPICYSQVIYSRPPFTSIQKPEHSYFADTNIQLTALQNVQYATHVSRYCALGLPAAY